MEKVLCQLEMDKFLYKGNFFGGFRHGRGDAAIFEEMPNYQKPSFVGDYKGNWKFSFRDGFGILTRQDGSVYEGEWRYDGMFGKGRETFLDGSKYVGIWAFNERHGCGYFTWASGVQEEREYSNGRLVRVRKSSPNEKRETKLEEEIEAIKAKMPVSAVKGSSTSSSGGSVLSTQSPDDNSLEMPERGAIGLKEKRAMKKLQDETVPFFEAQLKSYIGANIKFEVDWTSFTTAKDSKIAVWMLECNNSGMVFRPIEQCIEEMCKDKTSKEALAENVKKIVVKNKLDVRETSVVVASGTIEISGAFEVGPDSKIDSSALKSVIERTL